MSMIVRPGTTGSSSTQSPQVQQYQSQNAISQAFANVLERTQIVVQDKHQMIVDTHRKYQENVEDIRKLNLELMKANPKDIEGMRSALEVQRLVREDGEQPFTNLNKALEGLDKLGEEHRKVLYGVVEKALATKLAITAQEIDAFKKHTELEREREATQIALAKDWDVQKADQLRMERDHAAAVESQRVARLNNNREDQARAEALRVQELRNSRAHAGESEELRKLILQTDREQAQFENGEKAKQIERLQSIYATYIKEHQSQLEMAKALLQKTLEQGGKFTLNEIPPRIDLEKMTVERGSISWYRRT